jgi:hypothetical protein
MVEIDVERAEMELDALLERRAREAERANREAEAWAASERRYNLRQAEERRQAWISWHRRQAALFEDLAAEHREQAGKLIDRGSLGA